MQELEPVKFELIQEQHEEVQVQAEQVEEQEPVVAPSFAKASEGRPLPLQTEMEAQEELSFSAHEDASKYHRTDSFEQSDTFGCAVDSKDLDVPTFMRQK